MLSSALRTVLCERTRRLFIDQGVAKSNRHRLSAILKHSSRRTYCSVDDDDARVTFRNRVDVKPRGKLLLETTGMHVRLCNVLSLGSYVDVGVIEGSPTAARPSEQRAENEAAGVGLKIQREEEGRVIQIVNDAQWTAPVVDSQMPTLRIRVPVDLDVNVNCLGRGDVELENLRVSNVYCCTLDGNVLGENVQCRSLNVVCRKGDVVCRGPVVGNVQLTVTGKGQITTDRLQGTDIRLQSEDGEIRAGAVYAENGSVSSVGADVHLSNLHGNNRVSVVHGNLTVAGLDGSLTAQVTRGDAQVHVSRLPSTCSVVVLCRLGDVRLGLSDTLVARLRLEGADVVVAESIRGRRVTETRSDTILYEGHLNGKEMGTDPLIDVLAPAGKVFVETKNWFSSLNLGNT